MLYRVVHALAAWALRLYYRLEVTGPDVPKGPALLVGNHPNALVDPTLVFATTDRQITFLAKAPLFRIPVIGWIARGLEALPVYRRQDDATQMGKNDATLEAAARVLAGGGAVMLFPEGRSHSEPELGRLKTGAARICLKALSAGAPVGVVPVGLTYEAKSRFRSRVRVERGDVIALAPPLPQGGPEDEQAVRELTSRIAGALRSVTLNLDAWEDLPLLRMVDAFYALRRKQALADPARQRRIAQGIKLLRAEQPERFLALHARAEVLLRRLSLVRVRPEQLALEYRPGQVLVFAIRNLAALLLLPVFCLGMAVFSLPYGAVRLIDALVHEDWDMRATVRLLATLVVAPLWLALLGLGVGRWAGPIPALLAVSAALPLAAFTRIFLERRRGAVEDVRIFLALGSRRGLKSRLLQEGEALATEVERLSEELGGRLGSVAVTGP